MTRLPASAPRGALLAALLLAVASLPTTAQQPLFNGALVPAGATPVDVAAGDLDGDGRPDLVTASESDDAVAVVLQLDDGWSTPTLVPVGPAPSAVHLADLDGDGALDLVATVRISQRTSVLLGVGDGTFLAPVDHATGAAPMDVDTGDMDGDGVLDLLVACRGNDRVRFLPGLGDGSFGPSTFTSTGAGTGPTALTVVDVDGDGLLDVLTANTGSSSVSFLHGDGTGDFSASLVPGAGEAPSSLATLDANLDGVLDLAAAGSELRFRPGAGDGSFEAGKVLAEAYESGLAIFGLSFVAAVVAGDWNADGRPDLAASNVGPGAGTIVFAGQGDGSFATLASTEHVRAGLASPTFVPGEAVVDPDMQRLSRADLDGDGVVDVLATLPSRAAVVRIRIPASGATGHFTQDNSATSGSVTTADFDGDGHLDLIHAEAEFNWFSYGDGTLSYYGRGDGTFVEGPEVPAYYTSIHPEFPAYPGSLQSGDLDNDGRPDLVVSLTTEGWGNAFWVGQNQGDGTFSETQAASSPGWGPLLLGDYVGNGQLDLVMGGSGRIRRGVSGPSFGGAQSLGWVAEAIAGGDLNLDGNLDLVGLDEDDVTVLHVALGDGSSFAVTNITLPYPGRDVAVDDLDGDGYADAVVTLQRPDDAADQLALLRGSPTGVLPATYVDLPVQAGRLAVGDLGSDGSSEVIAFDGAGIPEGTLAGSGLAVISVDANGPGVPRAFGSAEGLGQAVIADFTSDGRADLAFSHSGGLTVFEHAPGAPWSGLGSGLAGRDGVPRLAAEGDLLPGSGVDLRLSHTAAHASGALVLGFAELGAPLAGGVLVPAPDVLVPVVADGLGAARVPFRWPTSAPPGLQTWWQAWWLGTAGGPVSATNALTAEAP